jgi:hypothetical protein
MERENETFQDSEWARISLYHGRNSNIIQLLKKKIGLK